MNEDPSSLSHLHDIVLPPDVSPWPLAPGWWVVITLILVTSFLILRKFLQQRRANAYRRLALRELEDAQTPSQALSILKRCALAAFPRTEISKHSGESWPQWLANKSPHPQPPSLFSELTNAPYRPAAATHTLEELKDYAANWIRSHKAI